MAKPLVVILKLPGCAPAKGSVAGIDGHRLSVSLLAATGARLDGQRRLSSGEHLTITFCSEEFGDTPSIDSVLKGVVRKPSGYVLTCEVLDWSTLAEFWARILRSFGAGRGEE